MLNRIVLIGRLTKKPELKHTANGTAVTTFTLAVDRFTKDEADFIPIVVWRSSAESCAKYLDKGKVCAVDGRLQIRTYEGTDGKKKTVAEVVADNVRFLSPKGDAVIDTYAEPEEGEMKPLDEIPF